MRHHPTIGKKQQYTSIKVTRKQFLSNVCVDTLVYMNLYMVNQHLQQQSYGWVIAGGYSKIFTVVFHQFRNINDNKDKNNKKDNSTYQLLHGKNLIWTTCFANKCGVFRTLDCSKDSEQVILNNVQKKGIHMCTQSIVCRYSEVNVIQNLTPKNIKMKKQNKK